MRKTHFFVGLMAITVYTLPLLVFAQTQNVISINPNIPGAQPASAGVCGWIVNFYSFALIAAGVLAFAVIVYGGFMYATSAGNASRQSEGRSWIWGALIGILLLASAYIILHTIYPGLTSCQLPTLSGLPASTGGAGNGASSTNGNASSSAGNGTCQAPSNGPCSVLQLQSTCMGTNAQSAGEICNAESSNNPNNKGDKCADGNYASIGLFQINISANTIQDPSTGQTLNCPSAFTNGYRASNPNCQVKSDAASQQLYQQCLTAALNPSSNITEACSLSGNGTNWSPWSTKATCGL